MKTLLTVNISAKTASDGDETWQPPEFVFGESFTLAMRLLESVAGELIEPTIDVQTVRAMIGLRDVRPASGEFALQIGPGAQTLANTTALLSYDSEPAQVKAAIAAKAAVVATYGAPSVYKRDGSWLIKFGTGPQSVPVKVVENTLFPVSLGRVSSYTIDDEWWQELRLVQAPVAADESDERVLPDAPIVTQSIEGGSDAGFSWNEVQLLYIPPEFRGSYVLKSGAIARTAELSRSDSAENIQAALVEILGEGNVEVTNPVPFTARIEFVGALAGATQPLLEAVPVNTPPGDLTITVELDKPELAARLRAVERVTLPLEVRIYPVEGKHFVAFVQDVTILRPVQWPELALTPGVDWLRPLSPKSYKPFSTDTVITGQQFYPEAVGDGVATVFPVDHGLDTDIVYVWVRENVAGGRQLVSGTDFTVEITNANTVEVTSLVGAPDEEAWLVVVVSAQTVGAFANGLTIEIEQVNGLEDILDDFAAAIALLQSYIPTNPPAIPTGTGDGFDTELTELNSVYPIRFSTGTLTAAQLSTLKGRELLPAVHDAATAPIAIPLPTPASVAGQVFSNGTADPITLPGGGGRPPRVIPVGGFIASDGRFLYGVTRDAATTSYYATDFERVLFFDAINAQQFRASKTFTCDFTIALQLLAANTAAHYVLVIEVGTVAGQSTPATTGLNLQNVEWNATPVLAQRIVFGPQKRVGSFGCTFVRSADGNTITASKTLYGVKQAAAVAPASADFAIRARVIQFDTENGVTNPKGLVALTFSAGRLKIS